MLNSCFGIGGKGRKVVDVVCDGERQMVEVHVLVTDDSVKAEVKTR